MSGSSKIEWTDATWNPIVGCSVVSPGCTNCYAMRMAARIEAMNEGAHKASMARDGIWGAIAKSHYAGLTQSSKAGPVWNGKVALASDDTLTAPLLWKRPRKIFVNSMGDLFHEAIPDAWIDRVFAVMALSPRHTFQVLTKRSKRMREYCSLLDNEPVRDTVRRIVAAWPGNAPIPAEIVLPLPNVWLGVSCEDQPRADERIPALLATPAAVRLVSAEPLIGAIQFRDDWLASGKSGERNGVDWIICGSESGRGARSCDLAWVRSIKDQCVTAGVPFFWKQHIENGRKISTPEMDGRKWTEFPGGEADHDFEGKRQADRKAKVKRGLPVANGVSEIQRRFR